MTEKRKIERLSPLVIRARFPSGSDSHQGFLTNLSESGAFLATDENMTIGELVEVDFDLPWGLGRHTAEASIVWSTEDIGSSAADIPKGVGLAFTQVTPEVKGAIRGYMKKFYELLARIDDEGLTQVLAKLSRETGDR